MIANYHTHTHRCGHASGTERDYIEKAIAEGLSILGFSDHVPMPFADGHQSSYRIPMEELQDYVHTLEALREEYRDRIRILIGFEAEYYPAYFEEMLRLLGQYDYDYLIMGQHFLYNEEEGVFSSRMHEDGALLKQYVDQVLTGLGTGRFSYLAHPDIFRFARDEAVYAKEMRRLCEGCLALGIPLEINLLGLRDRRHYPSDAFFRIAAEVGNDVIIGCDAHRAYDVADARQLAEGAAFAQKYGLRVLELLDLKRPQG